MRFNHFILSAAALSGSLLSAPASATDPARMPGAGADTAVGQLIAEQGNRALRQIRRELLDALRDRQPEPLRMRVAVAELPPPQP